MTQNFDNAQLLSIVQRVEKLNEDQALWKNMRNLPFLQTNSPQNASGIKSICFALVVNL